MKNYFFIFIIFFLQLSFVPNGATAELNDSENLLAYLVTIEDLLPENPDKWDILNDSKGIKLYKKKDSQFDTYKSECIIENSLEAIFKVLYDIPSHSNWVKYCNYSKVLKQINPNGMIHYYNFDMPWPFQNRDMVINTFLEKNWSKREIRIYGNAFNDKTIPIKKDHVRITKSTHEWILKEISPGLTRVTYKSRTILNDSMPDLIANHLSRTMPYSMLLNLKTIIPRNPQTPSERYVATFEKG